MIVAVTLGIPGAILAEATLAYLGIGAQPPARQLGQPDGGRPAVPSARSRTW